MTIWKFPFSVQDRFSLDLPRGAKILSVQVQAGTPCLWALVEPSEPRVSRAFAIFGTGHPIPDNPGAHIDTFQMHGGALVWHIFEAGGAV